MTKNSSVQINSVLKLDDVMKDSRLIDQYSNAKNDQVIGFASTASDKKK